MALNLKKNERDLLKAWEWLKQPGSIGRWVCFGYEGKTFDLCHVGSGDFGLDELTQEFSDGRIMYGAVTLKDPNSGLPKILFITWQGLGVQEQTRGKAATHASQVTNFFKGYHVNIVARNEDDLDLSTIMEKIRSSSGANYSIRQQEEKREEVRQQPDTAPTHSVATYSKVDPKKEIEEANKQGFWAKEKAQNNETPPSNSSYRGNSSSELHPKPMSVNRRNMIAAEKSASQPIIEKQQPRTCVKVASHTQLDSKKQTDTSEQYSRVTSETSIDRVAEARNITSGKAKNFKAMFEQQAKISMSQAQVPKPVTTAARKKWEPKVQPVSVQHEPPREVPRTSVTSRIAAAKIEQAKIEAARVETPKSTNHLISRDTTSTDSEPQFLEKLPEVPSPPPSDHEDCFPNPSSPPAASSLPTFNMENTNDYLPSFSTSPEKSRAVALYDYEAGDETEISFSQGDIIVDIVKDDPEWWVGTNTATGERGQLPFNFVALEDTPEAQEQLKSVEESRTLPNTSSFEPPTVFDENDVPALPEFSARVLFDYEAADDDELSIIENELITVLQKRDDGWWLALNQSGKQGLVPSNFLEL